MYLFSPSQVLQLQRLNDRTMSEKSCGEVRPPFTLRVATSPDEVQACYDIRVEVFVVEQGFSLDDEFDEHDPKSVHFLLTTPVSSPPDVSTSSITPSTTAGDSTEKPIGTIRFVPHKLKLTRLAVLKEHRQYGYGRVLVQEMENYVQKNATGEMRIMAKEDDHRSIRIKCHSQLYAIPFYQKLGYVPEGPQFDEDGAPHQLMVHQLKID